MPEIASAFVSVVPSAAGFGSKLNSQVSGGVTSAGSSLGKTFGKLFVLGAGVIAAAGIGNLLKGSIDEAREAQKVGAQTKAVLKSTGSVANVTAGQIGKLATALSLKTGVDDEAIQAGENMLLTFGKVRNEVGKGNDIFNQATITVQDMAAAFGGDATSNSKILGKALNDPIAGVSALTRVGVSFTEAQKEQIKTLVDSGDTLGAQKLILGELTKQTEGSAEAQATLGDKAKVAYGNIKEQIGTALLPAIDDLSGALVKVAPSIIDGIGKIGPAFSTVKGLAEDAIGVISDVAGKVDWGRLVGPLVNGLKSAKRSAAKLADSLGNIDLADLDASELGEKLGTALADAVEKFVSLAGKVTKVLGKMFAKVDWVGVGISIGKYIPALLLGLVTGILNFDFESLLKGAKDHWGEILIAVLTIAFAPSKIAGPLVKILERIPFVGKFLGIAVKWLNDLGSKLVSFGGDLLSALWRGFTGGKALPGGAVIKRVLAALKGLPGKVKDFMFKLQTRLGVWALDAFEAIGRFAGKAVVGLLRFVGSIPGKVLRALGSLARLLSPRGAALIEGLLNAIREKATKVYAFFKALPGKIKGLFRSAATLLYSIGGQIIDGLRRGIEGAAHKVADAVQAIINKIPKKIRQLMGISSPSKVTTKLGGYIGDGLAKGIGDSAGKVGNAVDKVGKKVKDKLAKLRDQLATSVSDFASLVEPISSNFTQGLFDFTNAADFTKNLNIKKIQLGALLANFEKLKGEGLSPGFLYKLFESGGPELIGSLANLSATDAQAAGALFSDVSSLSDQLGTSVAASTDKGAALQAQTAAITKSIEKLTKHVDDSADRFAAAVNGAASNGRRRAA